MKLDRKLVSCAINCDDYFRGGMARRFKEIAGISADSLARFRQWLATNGVRVDSVSKEAVTRLRKTAPVELDEALSLWELLSRTEAKKYATLGEAVCNGGRLRGLFRFCGHPQGRFSYPLLQLDNLPVCRSSELSDLRNIVRSGEFNNLDSQCESVTDILTQLFITSFIPRRKCRLLVVEYPALEQRILDWKVGIPEGFQVSAKSRNRRRSNRRFERGAPIRDDWEARASNRNYVQDEQPRVSEYFHDDPACKVGIPLGFQFFGRAEKRGRQNQRFEAPRRWGLPGAPLRGIRRGPRHHHRRSMCDGEGLRNAGKLQPSEKG